jgi:hypothetical protein
MSRKKVIFVQAGVGDQGAGGQQPEGYHFCLPRTMISVSTNRAYEFFMVNALTGFAKYSDTCSRKFVYRIPLAGLSADAITQR